MNMVDVTNKMPIIFAAIQAAPPEEGLLDSELATKVGIADRDALRSILAVMAADGRITAHDLGSEDPEPTTDGGWVDGEKQTLLRVAPNDAPNLRDRITEALVGAGVDGLEEDTLHDVLIEDVALDVPCALAEHMPDGYIQSSLDALIEAGIVASVGCNHYALTTGEWARRTVAVIEETIWRAKGERFIFDESVRPEIQAAIEHLLAGTEPR
jgi:hypothetical protein